MQAQQHYPQRGEVYWVTFHGQGREIQGRRPAVVVKNDLGNRYSPLTTVVAISSAPTPRVYPFLVLVPAGEAGLSRDSHINCAHLYTIDQARLDAYLGTLSEVRMQELPDALRFELEL
jgi:mRNA interferase MazF